MDRYCDGSARKQFFGFGWEFHYGDMGYDEAARTDDGFREVQLPHDWLMDYEASEKDEKSGSMNWKYGVGIYRKRFLIDEKASGRDIRLLFDGVYQDSTVYVNGHEAGHNFYGYIPFEYDITPFIRPGEENTVVVRVNNADQPNTRWYSGSGITRDVWIMDLADEHVAYNGSYIVTDSIDNGFAALTASFEIEKSFEGTSDCRITQTIIDPDGREILRLNDDISLCGPGCVQLTKHFSLRGAMLWSVDESYLYRCVTRVIAGGEKVDEYETVFGIRTIRFDAMKGFLLNGKSVKIHGMAIHNDAGQLGAAVPIKVWERRFRKLKAMGCNGIRTAHNPADPMILDLMDRMGIVCMDEFFDEWTICKWSKSRGNPDVPPRGYAEHFAEDHVRDCETIIRRDRNHPCVVLWSVGNECEEVYTVDGYEVMAELRDICHRMDPTRPVTEGTNLLAHNSKYTYEKFMEQEDVKGCNWFNIWLDRAELFYEPDKIAHPDWPILITETGVLHGGRGRYDIVQRRGKGGPFARPYYSAPVEAGKHERQVLTKDYISGVFYWTGVAYMGESPYPNRGGEGSPVDLAGFVNDCWYFYKSLWKRDEPVVHILPHWNLDIEEGTVIPVVCYTSCASAELFVNGKSYGEKAYLYPAFGIDEWPKFDRTKPFANTDDLFLTWDVPYVKGEITVLGYDREGREIARHEVRTVGEAAAIQAKSDTGVLKADGRDVAQIEISLLDEKGDLAVLSDNELTIKVTGGGRLLAADNGCGKDHTMGRSEKHRAYYGLLLAVIQADRSGEDIEAEITSPGLKGTKVTIKCE